MTALRLDRTAEVQNSGWDFGRVGHNTGLDWGVACEWVIAFPGWPDIVSQERESNGTRTRHEG